MDLPKRKPNRLINYDYSQNGAYFITTCVKDKQNILGEIIVGDDAHIVPNIRLSPYGIVTEKYINKIVGIDKFVIMPNHVHLIIAIDKPNNGTMWASSPTQSISQLVKSFKILVTKEIGIPFWQRSFHDHIIRNEEEYQKIWQYIDTNPLKWEDDCFFTK